MRVLLGLRRDIHNDRVVETYSQSFKRSLESRGHQVAEMGPGTRYPSINDIPFNLNTFDAIIELECGRAQDGSFSYQVPSYLGNTDQLPPAAVWFIDSHGNPTLHKRTAPYYNHVFFAVWDKRDLFVEHYSAHWCPNATDTKWFHPIKNSDPEFCFGFFGSKKGLSRADPMKQICLNNQWSFDIRQVNGVYKHRWPYTGEAYSNCQFLFNHGQKHDGPNLRVVESMAVGRPLICDQDSRSGMDKIFVPGTHYIPYETGSYGGLEEAMQFCIEDLNGAKYIAETALNEVVTKHLIEHRVDQILEVLHA